MDHPPAELDAAGDRAALLEEVRAIVRAELASAFRRPNDNLEELLRELLTELRARTPPPDEHLERLLAAAYPFVKDEPRWTAATLYDWAIDHITGARELGVAIFAAVGSGPRDATVKRLGLYLAGYVGAGESILIGRFQLTRVVRHGRDGAEYCLTLR